MHNSRKSKTEINSDANYIFISTDIKLDDTITIESLKKSLYYTINNNSKHCNEIVDLIQNKIKNKEELIELSDKEKIKFETIINEDIKEFNHYMEKNIEGSISVFARYRINFFYYDNILLSTEKNAILLTIIHLAQFAEFENLPDYQKFVDIHKKFKINIDKNNQIPLEEINFSILYGKSIPIGVSCISVGVLTVILSLFQVIFFWSFIFGIFAIIVGLLWFIPIK
jgi:hypothetical protein